MAARGKAPNLRTERAWLDGGHVVVAGSDEVGRGSLGGPVTVGVVLVDVSTGRPPGGLRDSKLLAPAAREALVPRIQRWALAWAVGHASALEIDRIGILRALRLAGERALQQLPAEPTAMLLDGTYDWWRRPARCTSSPYGPGWSLPHVEVRAKADLTCASVAAASVLAKVERDALMVELAERHPHYGWDVNKGYATPAHRRALDEVGPCEEHRRSWSLGGAAPGQDAPGVDVVQEQLDLRSTAVV